MNVSPLLESRERLRFHWSAELVFSRGFALRRQIGASSCQACDDPPTIREVRTGEDPIFLLAGRVRAGLIRARAKGKRLGRPMVSHQIEEKVRAEFRRGSGIRATVGGDVPGLILGVSDREPR